jgi:hypothetical protein
MDLNNIPVDSPRRGAAAFIRAENRIPIFLLDYEGGYIRQFEVRELLLEGKEKLSTSAHFPTVGQVLQSW